MHCLFEQSGTFKNEFKKLGIDAYDYDIQNEFNQTDYIMDLFQAIEDAYDGNPSIFDDFTEDDLIMAFFPCIRFENQVMLWFRGQSASQKNWSLKEKMLHCMKLQSELTTNYYLVNKLFIICMDRKLKLILENPYSEEHYLRRYWCFPAKIVDSDRRVRGDYFKKPTQYWFMNIEPKNNLVMEVSNDNAIKHMATDSVRWISSGVMKREVGIECSQKTARSMIHPQYANRFIREFILGEEFIQKQENEQLNLFKE